MSVMLCQRKLMHYRIPLFRRLNEALSGNLIVVHGQAPGGLPFDPRADLGFQRRFARNYWPVGEKLSYQGLTRIFHSVRPDVIVLENSTRNLGAFELVSAAKRAGVPVVMWGQGRSQKRPLAASGVQNALIHWSIRRGDAYVAYTRTRADEVRALFPMKPVFVATNTLDTDILFSLREALGAEGKEAVKSRLGLFRKHYLLFIGRLHPDKLPEYVLRLSRELRARGHDVGVLFIGQGPSLTKLEAIDAEYGEVRFLGEVAEWSASAPFIYASDILVMPQWVGLAANHGIALGTPVLAFTPRPSGPIHPPEIDFVVDGVTGFQVPFGDWPQFVSAAESMLNETERFDNQCIEFARQEISIDRWLDGMTSAIKSVTKG